MWTRYHAKVYPGLSRDLIWKTMTDINRWPEWHDDLEDCKLEGEFAVGNFFKLKPKGMRVVKIEITEIHEGFSFTDCTHFPGASMFDTHSLEETPEGLRIANKLVVTGFLSFVWIKLVAQNVANSVPVEIDALVERVRRSHGKLNLQFCPPPPKTA